MCTGEARFAFPNIDARLRGPARLHKQAGLPVAKLVCDAPIAKPINIENERNKFPLDFVHFLLSCAELRDKAAN